MIEDLLSIGVSGVSYEKDGFIKNTHTGDKVNDRQHTYGKVHLRMTPTDDLSASLIVSRLKYNDGDSHMNFANALHDREVSSDFQGYTHSSSTMGALKVNYKFSGIMLESVSTSREYIDDAGGDYDFRNIAGFHSDKDSKYRKISQEFRLSSQNEKLTWMLGFYGDKDENNVKYKMSGSRPRSEDKDLDGECFSFFAHLDWAFTDKFSFLTGIRYDREEKSLENRAFGIDENKDFDEISPKFSIQYKMNPGAMFYISASKGYQSGGFNTVSSSESSYLSYEEEKLWSYETGAKISFMKDRVQFNTALYYMDIEDMQVNNSVG